MSRLLLNPLRIAHWPQFSAVLSSMRTFVSVTARMPALVIVPLVLLTVNPLITAPCSSHPRDRFHRPCKD